MPAGKKAETIHVQGIVQGVGFRPLVWKRAQARGLSGRVSNTAQGVAIHVQGRQTAIDRFVDDLQRACPPLARIDQVRRCPADWLELDDFTIQASAGGETVSTHIPADAASCAACLAEVHDPANRRYQYPFTNCTHCGPRLSIIQGMPYDRSRTTMAGFSLCRECQQEYADPQNRRFHAQPNACPVCGPELWLETAHGARIGAEQALGQAARLLRQGKILAIKGVGGFHLAVDAGNEAAVLKLRARKQRPAKPFALMAADLEQIKTYCQLSPLEKAALCEPAAPIVLLTRRDPAQRLDCKLAPHQCSLGFMLPYTPLHHALMQQLERPLVMTSGNRSGEPQWLENDAARRHVGSLADAALMHNRPIANRVDDSVVRIMAGEKRLLRRSRGYAPASLQAPDGFAGAPPILALGGELKNTFCLGQGTQVVVSQHIGDLESHPVYEDYRRNLALYQTLYKHQATILAIDRHPDYLPAQLGRQWAEQQSISVLEVSHHHAHIAACLADNSQPLQAEPVLGIALDGLGYGADGSLWGGEFLLADYRQCRRLAHLMPVALPGGVQALREPWRNTYAHLCHYGLWGGLRAQSPGTAGHDLVKQLAQKPLSTLDAMLNKGLNCPPASSCGRLFDAVAACLGVCPEVISYEGQAALELEALADSRVLQQAAPYPFTWQAVSTQGDESGASSTLQISARPMWQALLADLQGGVAKPLIAACFHQGLAQMITRMAQQLLTQHGLDTIALSGGVFQNRVLLELVVAGLEPYSQVLTHRQVPANDGGLSLGQWAVAAATRLQASGEK